MQQSPPSDYQRHIEQALKNVLRKVKNPGTPAPQPSIQDSGRISSVPSGTAGGARIMAAPLPAKTSSLPSETLASSAPPPSSEEITYLEAEDLYTPMALAESETKEEQEVPLIADAYQRPFNIFEEFVETELNILLSRYIDLCRCHQCRADIVALALQQLPSYYVTGTRGTLTAKSIIAARYMQKIMDAVTKAIHVVYKRPRPSCQKIVQVLWLKPQLEELGPAEQAPEYFRDTLSESIELQFSEEVAEIIGIMEEERHYEEIPPESAFNPEASPSGKAAPHMNLLEGWD
jgi:competence protein ComFB